MNEVVTECRGNVTNNSNHEQESSRKKLKEQTERNNKLQNKKTQ